MGNSTYYKHYIQKLIGMDPATAIRKRDVKTPDGYEGYTSTKEEKSYTVRLYKMRNINHFILDSGVSAGTSTVAVAKLIADFADDIAKGDILTINDVTYRVTLVTTPSNVCKQAELEMI